MSKFIMDTHTIYPSAPINNYRLRKVLPTRALVWNGAFAGIYLSYETGSGEKFTIRGGNSGDLDFSDADSSLIHAMVSRFKELSQKGGVGH